MHALHVDGSRDAVSFFALHMVVVLFYCGAAIYNKSLKFQGFSRLLANVKKSQMYLIKKLSLLFADLFVLFFLSSSLFLSAFRLLC